MLDSTDHPLSKVRAVSPVAFVERKPGVSGKHATTGLDGQTKYNGLRGEAPAQIAQSGRRL